MPAGRDLREVKARIFQRIGDEAVRRVAGRTSSRTIQDSLFWFTEATDRLVIRTPYYWAKFLDQGRGPVSPVRAKKLIFFVNIEDDPRVGGGSDYPRTHRDIRRLTAEEFALGMEINRALATPDNKMPFMVVTDFSGPAAGEHFFKRGMAGLNLFAAKVIREELGAYMRLQFRRVLGNQGKATITLSL